MLRVRNVVIVVSIGYCASALCGRCRCRRSRSNETVAGSAVYRYARSGRVDCHVVFIGLHEHPTRPKIYTRCSTGHESRRDNASAPAGTF